MYRYKLEIEYDGTTYKGWQRQHDMATVQGSIEKAIFSFAREETLVYGAGRTDAGVHALSQIAHVDLTRQWSTFRLMEAINAKLDQVAEHVAILSVEAVENEFHARFSAKARHYLYRILDRRPPLALESNRAWWVKKVKLDIDKMNEAAQILLGVHDFTTFRATQCQARSPIKTLNYIDITRNGPVIEVRTGAPSFLHNQVRSIVGSLKHVGDGRWTIDDLRAALEARDHQRCGVVAPACGLYLSRVDYSNNEPKP